MGERTKREGARTDRGGKNRERGGRTEREREWGKKDTKDDSTFKTKLWGLSALSASHDFLFG